MTARQEGLTINIGQISPFKLGALFVEPAGNLIRSKEDSKSIQPKLMEVLVYLCLRQGETVSSDELVENCWPGQVVSDNPVHKCIAQLRKVLGDNSKSPTYIATIPRRGYRLIAEVTGMESLQTSSPFWFAESPYIGVSSYKQDHAQIFSGRTQAIVDIIALLEAEATGQTRWLMVSGRARVGKSSFIEAGLLPKLLQLPLDNGHQYCDSCVFSFAEQAQLQSFTAFLLEKQLLEKQPLDKTVDRMRQRAPATGDATEFPAITPQPLFGGSTPGKLIVFIDQLELLFHSAVGVDEQLACLQLLLALAQSECCLLITAARPETIVALDELSGEITPTYHYVLPELSVSELVEVINHPMQAAGLKYEYDKNKRESLNHYLLQVFQEQSVTVDVAQLILDKLARAQRDNMITFQAYEEAGGVEATVAEMAESAYSALDPQGQSCFEQLLFNFITVSLETERIELTRLVTLPQVGSESSVQLIESLAQSGIFRRVTHDCVDGYTLAHKSYLEHWPRIKAWVADNIMLLYSRSDVYSATNRWLNHSKNSDFLLNSRKLVEQSSTLGDNPNVFLSDDEAAFIQSSRQRFKRFERIKFGLFSLLILCFVGLTWLSISLQQTNRQVRETRDNAENLISYILYDLKDRLEPMGKLELLNIVGSKTAEYFELAGTDNLDGKSLKQWLTALDVLGQVSINKKDLTQATAYYAQRQRAIDAALAKDDKDIYMLEQSMLTGYWSGYIHYLQQHYRETAPYWRHYLNMAERLLVLEPDNWNWQLEHSYALNNLGSLSYRNDDLTQAVGYFNRSQVAKETLLEQQPDNLVIRADLADTLSWQAKVAEQLGEYSRANRLYGESLQQTRMIVKREPDNRTWQQNLYMVHYQLGHSYYNLGKLQQALDEIKLSHDLIEKLALHDRDNMAYQEKLLKSYVFLARFSRYLGALDAGLTYIDQASELVDTFKVKGKFSDKIALDEIRLFNEKALLLDRLGQSGSAMAALDKGVSRIERFASPQREELLLHGRLLHSKATLTENSGGVIGGALRQRLDGLLENLGDKLNRSGTDYPMMAIYVLLNNHIGGIAKQEKWYTQLQDSEYKIPEIINAVVNQAG